MTKKDELLKLHKKAYVKILLTPIEDRTKDENDFYFWYEEKHTEEVNKIKDILKSQGI